MAACRDFVQENITRAGLSQNSKPTCQWGTGSGGQKVYGRPRRYKPTVYDFISGRAEFRPTFIETDETAVQTDEILDMKFLLDAVENCQAKLDEKEENGPNHYTEHEIPLDYVASEGHNDPKGAVSKVSDNEKCSVSFNSSTDEEQDQERQRYGKASQPCSFSGTKSSGCTSKEGMPSKKERYFVSSIPSGLPLFQTINAESEPSEPFSLLETNYEESEPSKPSKQEEEKDLVSRTPLPKQYLKNNAKIYVVPPEPGRLTTISKKSKHSKGSHASER